MQHGKARISQWRQNDASAVVLDEAIFFAIIDDYDSNARWHLRDQPYCERACKSSLWSPCWLVFLNHGAKDTKTSSRKIKQNSDSYHVNLEPLDVFAAQVRYFRPKAERYRSIMLFKCPMISLDRLYPCSMVTSNHSKLLKRMQTT